MSLVTRTVNSRYFKSGHRSLNIGRREVIFFLNESQTLQMGTRITLTDSYLEPFSVRTGQTDLRFYLKKQPYIHNMYVFKLLQMVPGCQIMVLANNILFFMDINWLRLVLQVYFENMQLPALRKWLNPHFEYLSHITQFQPK